MTGLSRSLLLVCCLAPIASAADPQNGKTRLNAATFQGLKLRAIGPATMSGRISDIAVDPVKPNTWYVAAGSGNLWKTTNAGTTWTPIFENYPSYSIGCVTIDPKNRHTIWVGSGEAVGGRHVGYGDGVYLSRDGGKSFTNMGLEASEHIAKIIVDPRNSNVVYVAAQGPLWSPGGERGLYKTTNGGKTWTAVLTKGPYTGVTDIALHPRNPDVLFAVTHQRHRTVAALINGGPESGIHKSTDAGQTWRALKSGLPGADKGKMAIAISPQKPDVMYATIELAGKTGGLWRSEDAGETWSKQSDYISGGTGPHYYQELWADPHRFDVLYQANVYLGRSEDGGKTWNSVGNNTKHVDNHAVAFHPTDTDFVLVGCDGGLYRSYDFCKTWLYSANLPLTQFYKLSLDNDWPFYNVVGGTQDNNTQYGPTRTNNNSGIRNSDWKVIRGGDGHDNAIDPTDPNIIYCESQEGWLSRYDRRVGNLTLIRPQPGQGQEELRFNWDSPVFISPHSHKRIYFGSKMLHRSDDQGNSWRAISGDLSRNRDRFQMKMMGRVWSIDALWDLFAMSQYGNLTSITESPLQEDLLYVGTDDGLIQVTADAGKNWRKIDKIYGIPAHAFVNDVKADLHDVDTVYAVFDNHKTGDFKPYIMKSRDRGKTWTSIAGNLPQRHIVWRLVQDHVNKNLLFAGTEFGIFFTIDGGQRWIKLTGNVPTIPFRDLEIQKRENDLVGASFGRGFYVFDDYSALRSVTDKQLQEQELVLFPVRRTRLYEPTFVMAQARPKGSQGNAFFNAPNPPFGAVFTYYLRNGLKTQKQIRRARETAVAQQAQDNPRPKFSDLKAEEREDAPGIYFTIRDAAGKIVNRIRGPVAAGFHRVSWRLNYAGFGNASGPPVLPGKYLVTAAKRIGDETTPLGEPQEFEVVASGETALPRPNRKKTLAYQMQAGKLYQAVRGAVAKVDELTTQVTAIKTAIRRSKNVDLSLLDDARKIERALADASDALSGDTTRMNRSQTAPLPIAARVQTAYNAALNVYGPTATHKQQYEIAREAYGEVAAQLKRIIDDDLRKLTKKLDDAGVAWTTGRSLPAVPQP